MGFLRQIFGFQPAVAAPSSSIHTQASHAPSTRSGPSASAAAAAGTRRELLRVVVRNTLNRHGIPAGWVGAEMMRVSPPGREPGIHLRLLIKQWDPRLLACTVALQNSLIVRLMAFDPLASNWLMGISWQFALADESVCPSMPHPGSWTAGLRGNAPEGAGVDESSAPVSSGVIAGPVQIGQSAAAAESDPIRSADLRADLERLLAVRDAELKGNAQDGTGAAQPGYGKTQPVYMQTQPMDLADLQPLERDR